MVRASTVGQWPIPDADLSGANPVFYVSTTDNKVAQIVDGGTLGSSSVTSLFGDPTANTAFRGWVFLVPEPSAAALGSLGLLLLSALRRRK